MNTRLWGWLFWSVVVLSAVPFASALFTITMKVTPPAFHGNNQSEMGVEIVNSGNEPAFKASVTVKYPEGLSSDPLVFDRLGPNQPQRKTATVTASDSMQPGTYPLILLLQFYDSNNYPIYMVFDSALEVGRPSISKIYGNLNTVEFPRNGGGVLTLKMKNADSEAHTVRARLVSPDSIFVDKPVQTVQMAPYSEASVDYPVSNFMALQDSDLTVVAIMDYDDGTHHASSAQGRIRVTNKTNRPMLPFIIAAVLVVISGSAYYIHTQKAAQGPGGAASKAPQPLGVEAQKAQAAKVKRVRR